MLCTKFNLQDYCFPFWIEMTVQLENASATNTFFFVLLLFFFFTSNYIWLVNVKVMSPFFMKDGLTALCSTYSMASFILLF